MNTTVTTTAASTPIAFGKANYIARFSDTWMLNTEYGERTFYGVPLRFDAMRLDTGDWDKYRNQWIKRCSALSLFGSVIRAIYRIDHKFVPEILTELHDMINDDPAEIDDRVMDKIWVLLTDFGYFELRNALSEYYDSMHPYVKKHGKHEAVVG